MSNNNENKLENQNNLEAARFYNHMGFNVIPVHSITKTNDRELRCSCDNWKNCSSPGKHPIINWTINTKIKR